MARGFIAADAATLYGPGPSMGQGGGVPTLRAVAGDANAMSKPADGRPDMTKAPRASGLRTTLTDDPTFWLVATIGAAAFLAIYSMDFGERGG
jgi:hypothetical protein